MNSVTSKKSSNVYKSCPKRILVVKLKISTNLQKLPKMCWQFGENNCFHGLWKVAQSVINRPIWSHWRWTTVNNSQKIWNVLTLMHCNEKMVFYVQTLGPIFQTLTLGPIFQTLKVFLALHFLRLDSWCCWLSASFW